MGSIAHIETIYSAGWCGWLMLALGFCAVMGEVFQPGVISSASESLFAHANRTYKQAPDNFPGQMLLTLFRIGIPALALCLFLDVHSLAAYGVAAAMMVAMMVVKRLCDRVLDYTFHLRVAAGGVRTHYANIGTLSSMMLYVCLLVLLQTGSVTANRWIIGICALLFVMMVTYRLARIYVTDAKAILYLGIYILTLEVLPLGALVVITSQMTTNL